MKKLWQIPESKSNKLILIKDQTIYKGNPDQGKINKLTSNIETISKSEIEKDLFGIPYPYIKKIINQKGVNDIKILFGKDSEEELRVDEEVTKNEIFETLKNDIDDLKFKSEVPGFFSYCKAPLSAILILTGLFIWSMYYAIELEQGTVFELRGGGGRLGLGGIVFVLGNLGKTKLIAGYAVIMTLCIISLFRKLKSRTEREILYR